MEKAGLREVKKGFSGLDRNFDIKFFMINSDLGSHSFLFIRLWYLLRPSLTCWPPWCGFKTRRISVYSKVDTFPTLFLSVTFFFLKKIPSVEAHVIITSEPKDTISFLCTNSEAAIDSRLRTEILVIYREVSRFELFGNLARIRQSTNLALQEPILWNEMWGMYHLVHYIRHPTFRELTVISKKLTVLQLVNELPRVH